MKILFVAPSFPGHVKEYLILPSLELCILSSILKEKGHTVNLLDMKINSLDCDEKKELFSITYDSNLLVNEYLDLRKFVGWEEISAKQSQKSIENSDGIVVCRCNGNAIGCIRYIWDKGYTVFIVDAIVKPEWQRKGIGSTMLNYLLSMIDSKVGEGEKIMLNLYSSAGKEEFYKRAGFTTGTGMVKWIRK